MKPVKLFITSSIPRAPIPSNQFLIRFTKNGDFQVYPHDSPHAIKNEKTIIYPITAFFTLYISTTSLPSSSLLKKVRQTTNHQLILILSDPIPTSDFQSFCRYADIVPLIVCLDTKKTTPSYCLYCFPPKKSFKTKLRYIYPGIEYVEIPNHGKTDPKYQRMIYTLEEDFVFVSKYRKRFQRVNRNMGVVAVYKLAKYVVAKVMGKLGIGHVDVLKDLLLSSRKTAGGSENRKDDELRNEIEDLFVKVVESFHLRKHEVLELEWEPFSDEEMRKMGSNYLSYYVSPSTSVSHISPRVLEDEIDYPSPRKSFDRFNSRSKRKYYYNDDVDAIFSLTKEEEEFDRNRNQSKHYVSGHEKYAFSDSDFLQQRTKGEEEYDDEEEKENGRYSVNNTSDVEKHFKVLIRTIEKNCEKNIRNTMSKEIERLKKLYYLKEQKLRIEYEEKMGERDREVRRLKNHLLVLKERLRKCEGSKDLYHIDHTL